jgi:small subunit ribosomal protein S4
VINGKRELLHLECFLYQKKRTTAYNTLFREKQKVKRTYGMTEKQFRKFYNEARKSTGNTGTRLLQLLELRVDNVLYRAGFGSSLAQVRQVVNHGHVLLNGKKHDIASTILKPKDESKIHF